MSEDENKSNPRIKTLLKTSKERRHLIKTTCPRCGSTNVTSEQIYKNRPANIRYTCLDCRFAAGSLTWEELHTEKYIKCLEQIVNKNQGRKEP